MAIVKVNGHFPENRTVMQIRDKLIQSSSSELTPVYGNYYCRKNAPLLMTGTIVKDGVVQTHISFPLKLKMPLVRHANGLPTSDEEYFDVEIKYGVMTIAGTLDRSGDWKILIDRVNAALLRIDAPFKFDSEDITFLV